MDEALRQFACVKLLAEVDPERSYQRCGVEGFPCTVLFGEEDEIAGRIIGFQPPSKFVAHLRGWLDPRDE